MLTARHSLQSLPQSPWSTFWRSHRHTYIRASQSHRCVLLTAVSNPPHVRDYAILFLPQHAIVAVVMAAFMELLLLLLFRTALASRDEDSDESQLPGISNVLEHFEASFSRFEREFEPSHFISGIVDLLQNQPKVAFWASPPVGCCFALCPALPCGQPQLPSARLIAFLRRAVLVYASGAVIAPLIEAWVGGVPSLAAHRDLARETAHATELAVTLLALYSLFITYRLARAPLLMYHTTLKFAAIKVLVFVSPVQSALLRAALGPQQGSWSLHVLTVIETPLLALLLARAFPETELPRRAASVTPLSDLESSSLLASG